MASTPSARNRFNLQGHGDNADAWDGVLNNQVFALVDEALDGVATVTVGGNVTLSSTNYVSDQARHRVLKFIGAGGFTVTIPGVEKSYVIHNACTSTVYVKTATGSSVQIGAGQVTFLYCDGVNTVQATATGSSTFTTTVVGPAGTQSRASFRAPHASGTPAAPTDGDIWTAASYGLRYQINGMSLGPGVELISSGEVTNPTGVAVIDISLAGTTFRAYDIVYETLRPSTAAQTILMQASTDGAVTYHGGASDYTYAYRAVDSTGTQTAGGGAANGLVLGADLRTNSDAFASALVKIHIADAHATLVYKMIRYSSIYEEHASGKLIRLDGGGKLANTGASDITHIRIVPTAGTLFGSYALFGVR